MLLINIFLLMLMHLICGYPEWRNCLQVMEVWHCPLRVPVRWTYRRKTWRTALVASRIVPLSRAPTSCPSDLQKSTSQVRESIIQTFSMFDNVSRYGVVCLVYRLFGKRQYSKWISKHISQYILYISNCVNYSIH